MTRAASARFALACAVVLASAGAACTAAATSHDATPSPQNTMAASATARLPIPSTHVPAASPASSATAAPPTVAPPTEAPGMRSCAPPYPVGPRTSATVFCADPGPMQAARVLRVVDGDTIHVDLDGTDETIRFYGIDTTEVGQPCSAEATARTRTLVGAEVRLLPDARNRDRYGRLLRYVYSPAGLSIDAEMVDEGLAHAWRSDGALRFPIIELEDAARLAHRGCLWQS